MEWLKKIDAAVQELDEKPQFGLPSAFPLEKLTDLFHKLFNKPSLALKYQEKEWATESELWQGLGEHLQALTVEMTPLVTPLYFVLSEQDLNEMMSDLLGGEQTSAPFYDSKLSNGFFHYLALEVLQIVEEVQFAQPLSPRLGEPAADIKETIGQQPCFVIDVSMQLDKRTIWGRLFIPEAFRKEWKAHFSNFPLKLSEEAKEKVPVQVALEAGHTEISLAELKGVKAGDFIVLDRCSYDPEEKKGTITLSLGGNPLFRGKLKENGIQLLEYPLYEEGEVDMEEEPGMEAGQASGVENLPINLTVEVGRMQLSLQELSQLAPGNLVELPVTPEQGVDLVANGKKIGRGELVRIGETLGVRITTI